MIGAQTMLGWMWSVMGVYWFASALGGEKTDVSEARGLRILRLGLLCVSFILLLTGWLRIGWLGERFLPDIFWVRWTGVVVAGSGMLLCVWARHHLGEYWSDKVGLKVDHQLIRSGPYAVLRHPIYSGVLLGIAGSALAIGQWRGIVALAVMAANYWIKARREERMLSRKFGNAFEEYRLKAGFLLPKL